MRSRNLTLAGLPGRLRNFYVGDALRIDVLTVRPHLDKTNNGRRTPEKDSRRPAGEFSAHSSKISRVRGAVILELLSVNQKGASRSYSQRAFIEKPGMLPALRDVPLQRLGDLVLRNRSHNLLDDLSVLKQQQCGNSLNAIPAR